MTSDRDSRSQAPGKGPSGPDGKAAKRTAGLPPLPSLKSADRTKAQAPKGPAKEPQPAAGNTPPPALPPLAPRTKPDGKPAEAGQPTAPTSPPSPPGKDAVASSAKPVGTAAKSDATKTGVPAQTDPAKAPAPSQTAQTAQKPNPPASPEAAKPSPAQASLAPTPVASSTGVPVTAPPPATPPKAGPAQTAAPAPVESFRAGPIDLPSQGRLSLFSGFTKISFGLFVLLPLLLSAYYLIAVASDRFAVEVKFAIRSPNGLGSSDLLGLVTAGAAGGSTQSDSYMVIDYLESRQFLEAIVNRVDLPGIYGTSAADPLMRLPADATAEDRVDFLPRVVDATFDSTSQIITVETQAFTPQDAKTMAEAVLEATSAMINDVSEQARRDTVRLAEQELARAEAALKDQRRRVALFRDSEQKINPQATVAAQENVLSRLQIDLANELAEMTNLRKFLGPDSPRIRVLQSRIDSIEIQIAAERSRLGAGGNEGQADGTLNSSITAYEELAVDLDFRQRAYVSALASLESARIEADRQQRYLAAFVLPSLPQAPTYPRIPLTLAMIGAVSFLIWGVLSMFIHILREHLS